MTRPKNIGRTNFFFLGKRQQLGKELIWLYCRVKYYLSAEFLAVYIVLAYTLYIKTLLGRLASTENSETMTSFSNINFQIKPIIYYISVEIDATMEKLGSNQALDARNIMRRQRERERVRERERERDRDRQRG